MFRLITTLLLGLLFISTAQAQFQFFEQMFGGGGGGGGGQQRHHHEDQRDIPSDSSWYQRTADGAQCSKYLCPGTLACVDVPLHCPCAYPQVEEKFEFGDGTAMCISRGGYKPGEAARKVELARKGLL